MRHSLPTRRHQWVFGPLVLAGLSVLALCLPAAVGDAGAAVAPREPAQHRAHIAASGLGTEAAATALRATTASGLPAGGVLGNVDGISVDDILGIDQWGTLWLYPNAGSANQNMFGPRLEIGTGWIGYTLAAVGSMFGTYDGGGRPSGVAGILAIDPAGRLWYYQNAGCSGQPCSGSAPAFFPRVQVGTGWTGYTVVGLTDLYGTVDQFGTAFAGLLAIDPAGNLWYYPSPGGPQGLATFGARTLIGTGWTGYTADVAGISGAGLPDIIAVDSSGTMWEYPNNGGTGTATFGAPFEVGPGWSGYQAVDAGLLTNNTYADILAIDPAGNMWCYPNSGGAFGAPFQVGTGWTGFRIN